MSTARNIPSWSGVRPFLRVNRPNLHLQQARLERATTIAELRAMAARRVPRMVFDYVDGAAEEEISLGRARTVFRDIEFRPRVLRDVSSVTTTTSIGGRSCALPLGIAPTGFTRLMHTAGEIAGVRAADAHGIPFVLSTMGTVSLEQVSAAAPQAQRWFQLYLWRDRDKSIALVERARRAGYDTLVLTVDTPVGGARLRDVRNGMTVPPRLRLGTLADVARHPNWWLDILTTEPLAFASLSAYPGSVAELINEMFDSSLTFHDLDWLREQWPGRLVVKGVQTVDDARRCVRQGADAVILSNHGGRQLDRVPVPLQLLPKVKRALAGTGAEIYLDTGILSGGDVVAALALGADLAFVGRAYLYGLMAGGQPGVERAIEIIRTDIVRTLQLLGVSSIEELTPDHVRLPGSDHISNSVQPSIA
jgi:isopentenyl diphosphate isomerase/L-lactate dehydrogenase-like FMN-dependent dehydrogenase